jgi:4-hydroxybenzoyl-CoA thioesterase
MGKERSFMTEPSKYHFKVRWAETDAAGIVFFANFYTWMDEATTHLFKTIGYSLPELYELERIAIPLLETKCQHKSPLKFGDEVTILSVITELRDKVFTINHSFYKDGQLVAEGYLLRAWTSFANEKPKAVSIPKEVRDAIQRVSALV